MASTKLGALGVLLCVLAVSAEVKPQDNFNLQKLEGKWYLVGFASNADWFVSRKAKMTMGTTILTPQPSGDLQMDYSNLRSDGTCWKMSHLAQKSDIPGKFVYQNQRYGTDNDMRVVDVKYDEYCLMYSFKTKEGSSYILNQMYSRTQKPSQEVLKKFTKFSLDQGILPENIAILPKAEECS
ncbi:lipocalin-like [Astyanax mexicanus]|uniref:lipocalin-like n=1 Tax=Astyanax mexicanus TaxID=7994 RepID=UPI000BBD6D31|nr:lipocalin-like [Astyanax mexicanus]